MAEWLRVGEPAILVRLRRDRRVRRFTLRVSGSGDAPVLTVPAASASAEARRFAGQHAAWLQERMAARPPLAPVFAGSSIPLQGRPVLLETGIGVAPDPAGARLALPGPETRIPFQAAAFLRETARDACTRAVARYCGMLARQHGRITLRDPRSRWGSCTSRGDLMFSWRLAMAPPEVLEYVVAHEVAHLVEMNHSRRFWALVERIFPEHARARSWLRANGAGLHRYDFAPALPNSA